MQQQRTYDRIAQAIAYIQQNFQQQPQLDEVAAHIHLSPAHFQRLFTDWVGTSPKKFLQYTSVEYAKNILKQAVEPIRSTIRSPRKFFPSKSIFLMLATIGCIAVYGCLPIESKISSILGIYGRLDRFLYSMADIIKPFKI